MKIRFLGAARTVTGSMYLLTINGVQILLECGLYQGRRSESFERNRNLAFDAAQLYVMILSHAHIDHSGNIPTLVNSGFEGNILSTSGTRDLCSIMLPDSAHIQQADAAYVNKKRHRQGLPPVEPLYTIEEAVDSLDYFVSINYNRPFRVAPGVTLTYYDAGHILGSAMVCLDIQEDGRARRFLFTGDLGREGAPLLRDPFIPRGVEILITESTYGNRLHGSHQETRTRLRDIINRTAARGGKIIIPAFSVGRTQDIIYTIHKLIEAEEIPTLPVFVDSPLSVNATQVFLLHPECYDEETRQFLTETRSRNPFSFSTIHYIREVEQSKAINDIKGPAVIISASGMCETGRILHHLKNNITDPRNTIVIVGWQAPDTLGRRLVEKQEKVKIFGEEYIRRAEVEVLNGFSAHADRDELLAWFDRMRGPELRHVFVVHGEPEASFALAGALERRGVPDVHVPELGEEVEV